MEISCEIIIIIISLISNVVAIYKQRRIVGGILAEIENVPYLVNIRYASNNELNCGGSIISRRHVLTAAHCVFNIDQDDLIIYAGTSSSTNTSGPHYDLHSYTIHPCYIGNSDNLYKHDIAVIEINGRFVFNKFQQKISLPTKDVRGGEKGLISGWGKIQHGYTTTSEKLMQAPMTILRNEECIGRLPFRIRSDQFCGFEEVGIGQCVGDSGGPLIVNRKIVGIASFVLPCAEGVPDIYTKVYSHLDFIRNEISSTKSLINCNCQ